MFSRLAGVAGVNVVSTAARTISSMTGGRLQGKVAIVTASSDGIGYAIAEKLIKDGAKVMISSRKEKNVNSALEKLRSAPGLDKDAVHGVVCHVGSQEDRTKLIESTVKYFGGIDYLVSNAAANPHMGPTLDCTESAWDKIFEINVKSAFLLTKEVHPHMLKRRGGSIVYISSIGGFQPISVLGPYSVSKTALLGLTKAMAAELASDNIRVNCVAPGIIRTKFSQAMTETPAIAEKMMEVIPMGRFGEISDIGGVVSFLCSNDAAYVTGENIVVAGGMSSRL